MRTMTESDDAVLAGLFSRMVQLRALCHPIPPPPPPPIQTSIPIPNAYTIVDNGYSHTGPASFTGTIINSYTVNLPLRISDAEAISLIDQCGALVASLYNGETDVAANGLLDAARGEADRIIADANIKVSASIKRAEALVEEKLKTVEQEIERRVSERINKIYGRSGTVKRTRKGMCTRVQEEIA